MIPLASGDGSTGTVNAAFWIILNADFPMFYTGREGGEIIYKASLHLLYNVKKEYKTIKIEVVNYERLVRVKGFLEQKMGQAFSMNDVIETLLDLYDEAGGEYFATPMEDLGLYYVRGTSGRVSKTKRGNTSGRSKGT